MPNVAQPSTKDQTEEGSRGMNAANYEDRNSSYKTEDKRRLSLASHPGTDSTQHPPTALLK